VRLTLKVVMKNNRDFMDVILIYVWLCVCSKSHVLLVYEKTYCTPRISTYLLGVDFLVTGDFYTPTDLYLIIFIA